VIDRSDHMIGHKVGRLYKHFVVSVPCRPFLFESQDEISFKGGRM
jgi:hypothetical protein